MKKLFLLLLSFFAISASAADMVLPFRSVSDGDTIATNLKLPCPLCNASVRILGIDTPESNYLAKCPAEKAKGLAAKAFLQRLFENQESFVARNVRWDKYGGRILAYVEVNGQDVGELMIKNGFARPYFGQGPKPDWCS